MPRKAPAKTIDQKKAVGHTSFSEEDKKIAREFIIKCWESVEFFARNVLGKMLEYEVPEFHKDLYYYCPRVSRMVVAAPRGFAKSTVCSVIYPIWVALTQNSFKHIMIVSASESLAVELLRKIKREFETNETLIKYFGDLRTEKWSETHIVVKNLDGGSGFTITAKGAGAQIRGFRPDCMILDDIETDEGVESEEQRSKLKDWLFKSALNTLLPHGQLIMVGTILSPLSLLSELLETQKDWNRIKYMAYKDAVEKEGYELWPSLWPHEAMQKRKREIGSFSFACEFMNSPVEQGALPIKERHIRLWKDVPEDMACYMAIDPAYSENENADYKVCVLVGVDGSNNRYLIDYVRTHADMNTFMHHCMNIWRAYSHKVVSLGVPCSGPESEFYRSFTEYAHRNGFFPPIVQLKNVFKDQTGASHRKKVQRIIAALQPIFEAGKYYIGEHHEEARSELLSIGASKHDDVVDALAYAESLVMLNYETEKSEPHSPKRWWETEEKSAVQNYGYAS